MLGRVHSTEKPAALPSPREHGIRFIRDIHTQFEHQYGRIPFGPGHNQGGFVVNPFKQKPKKAPPLEDQQRQRALSQQKAQLHKQGIIFISLKDLACPPGAHSKRKPRLP